MTAVLWIALSDRVVGELVSDPEALVTFSTLKGWLFVAVTGAMLAVMLARYERTTRPAGQRDRSRTRTASGSSPSTPRM